MPPQAPPIPVKNAFANPTSITTGSSVAVADNANHYVLVTATATGVTITVNSTKSHTIVNRGTFSFLLATTGNSPVAVAPGVEYAVAWNSTSSAHIIWPHNTPGTTVAPTLIDVRTLGAKGDSDANGAGSTDDRQAIQDAIDAGGAYLPGHDKFYRVTGTLTNPDAVPVVCEGTIVFTGASAHGVTVGKDTEFTIVDHLVESVYKIKRATTSWVAGQCGVLIQNLFEFRAAVSASGFNVGLKCLGNPTGCAYGTINLGAFWDNKWGVEIEASGTGYCNQITWIGGRLTTAGATNFAGAMGGFHFICETSSTINGHVFVNPNLEIFNQAQETFGFYGESATQTWVWQQCLISGYRLECSSGYTTYLVGGEGCRQNTFIPAFHWHDPWINDDVAKGINGLWTLTILAENTFSKRAGYSEPGWRELASFQRSSVTEVAAGNVTAPARGCWKFENANFGMHSFGGVTLQKDEIRIDNSAYRAVGFIVDLGRTTALHHRMLRIDASMKDDGSPNTARGQLVARVWDATGVELTSTDHCSLGGSYHTNKGFLLGGEMNNALTHKHIAFSDTARYVFIGVTSPASGTAKYTRVSVFATNTGEASLMLDGTWVDTLAGSAQAFTFLDTDDPKAESLPIAPSAGDAYPKGQLVRAVGVTSANGITAALGWIWPGSTAFQELPGRVETEVAGIGVITTGTTPAATKLRNITMTYAGAESVTDFTGGVEGQTIQIRMNTNVTLVHGATIKLEGGVNFTPGGSVGASITLRYESGVWWQIGEICQY